MFKHEKMLFHPVEIEKPNPQYAVLLPEQLGGSNRDFGTTKAARMYFSMSDPGPDAFVNNETTAPSFNK